MVLKFKKFIAIIIGIICIASMFTSCSSKKALKEFSSLEEIDKKENVIAAELGTSSLQEAKKAFKNASVIEYNSITEGIMAVKMGKVQGFTIDQSSLAYAMAVENIKGIKAIDEMVGDPTYIVSGISRKTTFPNLKEKINEFIAQLKNDGTLDDIYKRWIVEANDKMPQIDKPTNPQGKLVVATTGLVPPYSYYKGEDLTGMDLEIIYRLANYLNVELEIKTYDFMGIPAALEANHCDCVFSNLNATDERREVMDFSDPILVSYIKLVIASNENEELSFFESLINSFEKTFIRENRWQLILYGILTTIVISIASGIFGTLLGFGICMLYKTKNKIVCKVLKIIVRILQGMPITVLLLIMYYVVFSGLGSSGVIVSIITFSLNFAAYTSEILQSGINTIGVGQTEAALALGYTKSKAFFRIVFPQAACKVMPIYKNEFISLVKMTSIVGFISVQDLTRVSDIIRARTFEAFFPLIATAIIYFIISYLLTTLLKFIEIKIEPKRKNRIIKGVKLK